MIRHTVAGGVTRNNRTISDHSQAMFVGQDAFIEPCVWFMLQTFTTAHRDSTCEP